MYINNHRIFVLSFLFSFSMMLLLFVSYPKAIAFDLASSVVRLHVRANSDSYHDQQLKLKVRDSVVEYMQANMNVQNRREAIDFICNNRDEIIATAQKTVVDNGYNYSVSATPGYKTFPDKYYGNILFPGGKYYSLNINIGSGEGHNWWCVLYPPLCLIDNVTAKFDDSSKDYIRQHTTSYEYSYITENNESHKYEYATKPKIRFKYFTFLNRFLEN